jgi:hypothetical protein
LNMHVHSLATKVFPPGGPDIRPLPDRQVALPS